mmetsp:Transcript_48617/g.128545  ORF Transcript_48617/g.128545 Transcript_48617/m.128545 type:complete len:104 (-) Transcript_48617:463-774(-)
MALEDLPRCTFCISAGLHEQAIGHTVTDSNGIVTCPLLIERNKKLNEIRHAAAYNPADAIETVDAESADRRGPTPTRKEAWLGGDLAADFVPKIYDPYYQDDD